MGEETVVCTYRVRTDAEDAFATLLERHWATLHRLELVTDEPSQVLRSVDDGPPVFVEVFTWRHGGADLAHEHPDVLAIWEPMDQLCESRDGRPAMEFPHYRPVTLDR